MKLELLLNTYLKIRHIRIILVSCSLFFMGLTPSLQAQFEYLKPLEEAPLSSEKFNFSTVVEGDDAYYFIYRLGGPDAIYDTHRFQLVKTDLEGNTLFHKEIATPEGIDFFWGYNLSTPPPMAYADGHLSVLVSAMVTTIDIPYDEYFFQLVFDENGDLLQSNSFEVDLLQEFFEITSTEDGFLFATSPIYVDVPEAPTHLHIYKTDFDGDVIWEKAYQYTEGYNTIYLKDILQNANGDIYIAMFNYPLAGGLTYGEAIMKLDSDGEFLFAKRFFDPDLIGGNIYNMSLAFQTHNSSDELYLMSSWTATISNIWRTNLFRFNDNGALIDSKQLQGVEYASHLIAPDEGGTTILIGKNGGDPISNSFANWGDPVLIHFNSDFSVDWAYAYGGEDVHYTDDMIYTDQGYLISARSASDAYIIQTDLFGASVCETKSVELEIADISFTEESPEVSDLGITHELNEAPIFTITDIPFYNTEEKCCPYGLPVVGFEFSFGEEDGQLNFLNTTTNADSYDWIFGDTEFSTEENTAHQYGEPGLYEVCLMATNDCGSIEYCEEILVEWSGVGLAEWQKEGIQIYSSSDGIHIQMSDLYGADIQLRNMLGQIVYQYDNVNANESLLLPKQEAGVYFCEVIYNGTTLRMEKVFVD